MMYLLLSPLILYAVLAIASLFYALSYVPFATRKAVGDFWQGVSLVGEWFALLWLGLVVELFGVLIGWAVILFADHRTGRLPAGFHWLETHDAVLPGYPPEQGFNTPYPQTWWAYYQQSVCWLYRNRVYRFAAENMGIHVLASDAHYHYGDFEVSDEPPVKLGSFVEVTRNCFEIQKAFAALGRNWEWRIGYKLAWTAGKTAYAQHVMRLRSGSPVSM